MERSAMWRECVKALIQNLTDATSPAAREVGKIWEWAFSRLEHRPDDFNQLQDTRPETQISFVQQFLKTCEARARGENVSDRQIVEYAVQNSLPVSDAPPSRQLSHEVADALAAFGMFLGHEGQNTIDSPGRFCYTTALFGLHEEIFKDILASKQVPKAQRDILEEVAKHVPRGDTEREYFRRCEAAADIQRLFGFSKHLLTATDVYQRGFEFYNMSSRIGPALTLTFSNTSGLWNPLERNGTAQFIRRYGVDSASTLKFKDSFRSNNFTAGILNPVLGCRRLYLFNQIDTWQGFPNARSAARDKAVFDEDARKLVEEVCVRMEAVTGRLYLVAIRNWADFAPLGLVTRVSDDVVMFSNRGSDLSISHAFWCDLNERGRIIKERWRRVSTVLKAVTDMASGGLLTVLDSLLPFLESLFGKLEYVTKAQDLLSGERMRRLLDDEPPQILRKLSDRFALDLEYITAPMLRHQLSMYIDKHEADAPTTHST